MNEQSPVAVPVFVALFMAATLVLLGSNALENARTSSFLSAADREVLAIENKLRSLGQKSTAVAAAIHLRPDLTQQDFRQHLLETGIIEEKLFLSAIVDKVPVARLDGWAEEIAANNGWTGFSPQPAPSGEHTVYPVRYNSHDNEALKPGSLGEDNWDRSVVIEMAEAYDGPFLGTITKLSNDRIVFPYSIPFYEKGQDDPGGFILMQVDVAGLLKQGMSAQGGREFSVRILEEETGQNWLLAAGNIRAINRDREADGQLGRQKNIILPGAAWTVTVEPMPGYYERDWPNLALAGVTAIALVLLALSFLMRNRETQQQLQDTVEDRTRELRAALEVAERANASKTRFLGSISHELKTPLNSIIGFSEVLEAETADADTPQHNEYARFILNSGQRLLGAVNNILALTKVEAGEISPVISEVYVAGLIKRMGDQFADACKEKDILLEVLCHTEERHLQADAKLIQQALQNLLSNAVKFTPAGGTVILNTAITPDGALTIRVSDNGPGMTKEEIDNAILPFEQVEDLYIRKHEGVGLGLPLALAFIELCGGKLDVEATPGEGTSVLLLFPPESLVNEDDSNFL